MTRALLVAAGLLTLALSPGAEAGRTDCGAPQELIEDDELLPQLSQDLRERRPVTIVAIGGATTAGIASGNPERDSYPRRLEEALRRRHPGAAITVLNKGVSRETTQEMVDRFPRDVYPAQPTLVIWETGTFDAARNVDVDVFATALQTGIADLQGHKLDIMLVNMQYSRSTASVINFEPYLTAMQHRADVDGVYLFRRFELMKHWSESGVFQFEDVPKNRRSGLAAEVYDCIGERLAEAIEHAIR
jgi:acyl-CoA thioesterase-1